MYFEQNGDVLVKRGGVLVVGAIWPVAIDKILHGKQKIEQHEPH